MLELCHDYRRVRVFTRKEKPSLKISEDVLKRGTDHSKPGDTRE